MAAATPARVDPPAGSNPITSQFGRRDVDYLLVLNED